jgi:hypothetical protein
MKYLSENVLSAPDTSSQIGMIIDGNQLIAASFHCYFSDTTVVGTLNIQGSNDIAPYQVNPNFVPTNWINIPLAGATITSGSNAMITIDPMVYRWLRVNLTVSTPGTGTVTVNMFAQSE